MHNGHGITATNDRLEILAWLSPLEPHLRHHEIRTNRVKDVGDWLLRTEEFRSWRNGHGQDESQKAAMFCPNNPGVGKTYIRWVPDVKEGKRKAGYSPRQATIPVSP